MALLLGYVGYEEGGILTKKVRQKPYSIILFDEVEKAHSDIMNMLLQILEDGRLTDNTGKTIDFKNTVIIMTSNIGAKIITDSKKLGFTNSNEDTRKADYENIKKDIMQEVKREFRPEFINRIDEIIVFHKLEDEDLERIVEILIDKLIKRLKEQDIILEVDESIRKYIVKQNNDKNYGARPLRRAVQTIVEDKVTDAILAGILKKNEKKVMREVEGKFIFE